MYATSFGNAQIKWVKALGASGSTWRATNVLLANKDLLVLGADQKIPNDDLKLYIYDTETLKWSGSELRGPSPKGIPNTYFSAQTSPKCDKIYLFHNTKDFANAGDSSLEKRYLKVSQLDFSSNMQWSELTCSGEIPTVCSGFTTTRIDSLVYLFGGMLENGEVSNRIYTFDLDQGHWEKISLHDNVLGSELARVGHSATLVDENKIFIFGGKRHSSSNEQPDSTSTHPSFEYSNDALLFDTKLHTFEKVVFRGISPQGRAHHTMNFVLSPDGRKLLVLFGGCDEHSIYNGVSLIDYETMAWLDLDIEGEEPSGRFSHFSGSLNSQVIYFGGEDHQNNYFDIYFLKIENLLMSQSVDDRIDVSWNESSEMEQSHEPNHQASLGRPSNLFVDTSRSMGGKTSTTPSDADERQGRESPSMSAFPLRSPLMRNPSGASLFTNKHIVSMLENTPGTPVDEKKPLDSFPRTNSRRNSIVGSPGMNRSPSRRSSISGRPSSPRPRSTTPISFYGDKTPPRSGTPTSVIEDDEEQAAQLQETFGDLSRLVAHKKILKQSQEEPSTGEDVTSGAELEFNVSFGTFNFGGEQNTNQLSASLAEFCKTEAETIQEVFSFLCNSFNNDETEKEVQEDGGEETEELLHMSTFLAMCKITFILSNGISVPTVVSILQSLLDEDGKTMVDDSIQLDLFRKILLRIAVKKYGQLYDSSVACYQQLVNRNLLPHYKKITSLDPYDSIFGGESVSLMREYDSKFKELFMLYATLGLSSAHQPTWEQMIANNTAVSIPEFLQLGQNFDIVPYLIPRHIFVKIVQSTSLRDITSIKSTENGLNFPEFVESLFRVALYIYSKYPYSSMMKTTRERLSALLISMGFDDKKIFNLFVKSSGVSVRNKHKYKTSGKKSSKEINNIIQDPEALRSELAHVFMYYCAFGDPLNLEHMSGAKFTKFVKDIQVDKFVNKEAADLIYVKLMKNRALRVGEVNQTHYRMTFPYFMEGLKVISTRVYPKLDPQEALYELLKNHVFPHASKEPRKFEHVNILEVKTQELFTKYKKQLLALFHSYCTKDTLDSHNFGFMTIDAFTKLAVQFDITPTLVAKKDIYRIFRSSLLNSTVEDIDYQQFEECIAKVAYLGYSKHPYDIKYKTLDQKLYAIFEKIGLLDWTTLKKILEKLGHKVPYSPNKNQKNGVVNTSGISMQDEGDFGVLPPESELDFELRCIFAYYSEFGNRFGKQSLGLQQYNRFCKDCLLFDASFAQADGDLVYVEVSKNDQQKLSYELFCDSLTFLAERKYSDMTTIDALRKLLLFNILPNAQRKHIKEIVELEPVDSQIMQVIQLNEVPLQKVFDTYRKLEVVKGASAQEMIANDSILSLVELLRMAQDFDICPTLLSVSEVTDLFRISTFDESGENDESGLDFGHFLECIGRIATKGYGKPHFSSMFTTGIQKGEALMERMDLTSAIRLTTKLRSIKIHSVVSEK